MARLSFTLVACLAIAPIVSCCKSSAPAPCGVVAARDVKLDDGTELRIWDLRTSGLHRLTARLLVASDGKAQTALEVESTWEPGASTTGQLVLLIQDGKAFGAKGCLPLLALNFPDAPHATRNEISSQLVVAGGLRPTITIATTDDPRVKDRKILYAKQFVPEGSVGALDGSNVESLVESSRGGRSVIAVVLEWVLP